MSCLAGDRFDLGSTHYEGCACHEARWQKRVDALERRLADWEAQVGAEMPADFKDWRQNSPEEHPYVSRLVLAGRREEIGRLDTENARLRAALEEIEKLDYSRAATNGAAFSAVRIAQAALRGEEKP